MKPRVLNILPDTFFTILERSSATFLGFSLEPLYYESLEMPNRVAQILLLADMLPYVAIVFIVAMIGSQYSTDHALLTQRTVYAGSFFCYGSILLNFMALVYGNEILLTHKLLIFSGLYQFSFATQVFKVMLLLILGALYSLLHVNVGEQLRSLELPLLIQITVALCITVLSANNFALILLALEGFSLTLYIMTALARSYGGITASVKYFAFGTLGSIFLFWGAVHLYATTGTLSVDILEIFLRLSSENTAFLSTNFATTAIALGFLLKIGAAPTHQ
jgi:NADH:ubiquinone oxidoreductase subunit 2 (subunit N)